MTINYDVGNRLFCSVRLVKSGLRVWLHLDYRQLENAPAFVRDVSNVGHYGSGNLELQISNLDQAQAAEELIRKSLEARLPRS